MSIFHIQQNILDVWIFADKDTDTSFCCIATLIVGNLCETEKTQFQEIVRNKSHIVQFTNKAVRILWSSDFEYTSHICNNTCAEPRSILLQ